MEDKAKELLNELKDALLYKPPVMYCRKCKQKLEKVPYSSFDFTPSIGGFDLLYYCDNKECEMYGIVIVAGLIDKEDGGK